MKVLVTGAGGWIGRATVAEIEARDVAVFATGDRNAGIYLDVADRAMVLEYITTLRPDVIVNLAGRLGTDELQGHEHTALMVNTVGAINVYDAAAMIDARVVQIGTGHYGQPNTYAMTKALAEDIGLQRARDTGQPISVVRAYHAYGPGQAWGDGKVRKIIPSFVTRALRDEPIEIFGDGGNVIDLVPVSDVAIALADVALDGAVTDVVEAGTGVGTPVLEVARDVVAACGSQSGISHLPPRIGEPEGARVVATRPICPHHWPYMIDETIQYYADQVLGDRAGA